MLTRHFGVAGINGFGKVLPVAAKARAFFDQGGDLGRRVVGLHFSTCGALCLVVCRDICNILIAQRLRNPAHCRMATVPLAVSV